MRMKKFTCLLCVFALVIGCLSVNIGAIDNTKIVMPRATGRFTVEVPAKTIIPADSTFPLEIGETVTIKATYSPFDTSVDFGLIAPDGLFYSLNCTTGSFDETIEVTQRGHYTFAIRNNSSEPVEVK